MEIKEFQSILENKKADFALFYNLNSASFNPNLFYFTGYNGLGILVIPKQKNPFLIVPKMEYQRAKKSFKRVYSAEKKRLFETLKEKLKKNKIKTKKIALDKSFVTLSFNKFLKNNLKNFKTADISNDCLRLREIKNNEEIEYVKKACCIADNIFSKLIKNFKDFKTETEIASFLEFETKKLGCDASFPPIVASGKNASMPHHIPKNAE